MDINSQDLRSMELICALNRITLENTFTTVMHYAFSLDMEKNMTLSMPLHHVKILRTIAVAGIMSVWDFPI